MRVYIIEGFLYGTGLSDDCELKRIDGEDVYASYVEIEQNGILKKFAVCCGGQPILVPPGKYKLVSKKEEYPVAAVFSRRVSRHQTKDGQKLPFGDDVYPVITGQAADDGPEFIFQTTACSRDIAAWPKILRDGNEEQLGTDGKMADTYPKPFREGEPYCLSDFGSAPDEMKDRIPLKHGDCLNIRYQGKTLQSFYWDQISKIWHEKKLPEENPMVPIRGGSYRMGDYRGKLYNYSFGKHNVNMKKNWEQIYDPQYMGEKAFGKDAVGAAGLWDKNSMAADARSDFWCYNEDAVSLHEVTVSDFEMGKYQVTMDQFYLFVSALSGEDERSLFYEIDGRKYGIHQIAGIGLFEKKQLPRDNGWGLGSRPAVNVCFHEMAEYCNWLSRKSGYELCYTIAPIYHGEYAEGLSEINVFRYVAGSQMQIRASRRELCQLVEIRCDLHKNGYRLPTEAEFEYAIRGDIRMSEIRGGKGALFAGISGDSTEHNCDVSWQRRNTDNPQKSGAREGSLFHDNMGGNGYTSPVGALLPSQLGLYDLSGNVWEVMNDVFSRSYFAECEREGKILDPQGPEYTLEQLSDMRGVNADAYMEGRYAYTYEKQTDGSMKRTGAVSIAASGKTHHVLRGGCFTNPFPFTSALHRHAAGGISYLENFVNHYNARTGFRLCRSLTDKKEDFCQ